MDVKKTGMSTPPASVTQLRKVPEIATRLTQFHYFQRHDIQSHLPHRTSLLQVLFAADLITMTFL